MKFKYTLIIAILLGSVKVFAQSETNKPALNFSGFINVHAFYDTRQTINGREAMLLLYPARPSLDPNGKDINAAPQLNQLAMTSRLTATAEGVTILNAKTKAVLEGDYSGQTNGDNNGFRLRHAYVRMDWERATLLVGQYWHPINIPEAIPRIESLNTGAPFRPFSRAPQIRFEYNLNKLKLVAVASSQRDYQSFGPAGQSSEYLRNAVLPNIHIQLQYHAGHTFLALGGDMKMLKPALSTDLGYKTTEKIASFAATAFVRFQPSYFDIKFQTVLGQNLAEHILLGGYVQASQDPVTEVYTYANSSQFSIWTDIKTKHETWNYGLFIGFAQNLGYSKSIETGGEFFGRGRDISNVYRISPQVSFTQKNFTVTLEPDYTDVAYGDVDLKGKVSDTKRVGNLRLLLTLTYKF